MSAICFVYTSFSPRNHSLIYRRNLQENIFIYWSCKCNLQGEISVVFCYYQFIRYFLCDVKGLVHREHFFYEIRFCFNCLCIFWINRLLILGTLAEIIQFILVLISLHTEMNSNSLLYLWIQIHNLLAEFDQTIPYIRKNKVSFFYITTNFKTLHAIITLDSYLIYDLVPIIHWWIPVSQLTDVSNIV